MALDVPVIVRINRRRCVFWGSLQAVMGLFVFSLVSFPIWVGVFDWVVAMGLLTAGFFFWFATYYFALAWRNPVALRMDDKGVSGYYADPATWDEVARVHAFTGERYHRFLGFELNDPISFRDRQSAWRRYLSWANGRANKAHLVVPQIVLQGADVEDLAKIGTELLEQHGP